MNWVKQLQAIAIAGFWRAKAHMDVHQQKHAPHILFSGCESAMWSLQGKALRTFAKRSVHAGSPGLRPWAGQERHVFDFPLSLLWLPLSCLLLLPLKVQLLTDQISGLGISLPLKHNTEIQSLRGLDSGGGLSWTF